MNTTIQKLSAVISALNTISVNGKHNLSALFGSIDLLESIVSSMAQNAENSSTAEE